MTDTQLSLNVTNHPALQAREAAGAATLLTADLQIKGRLPLDRDLNHGDRLFVNVTDSDGEVLSSGYLEVAPPHFEELTEKHAGLIGLNRAHKATLTEET